MLRRSYAVAETRLSRRIVAMAAPMTGPSPTQPQARLTHWQVVAVAFPIVLANASTPLLGVVDTTIIGQLGPAFLIGAVALGAVLVDYL